MDELEAQIREELRRILEIVCELTGLPSNWNGRLKIVPDAEFRGRKPFLRAFSAANAVPTRRPL
jgi:hypothetical protein